LVRRCSTAEFDRERTALGREGGGIEMVEEARRRRGRKYANSNIITAGA
jgi:hypothetical protein